MIKRLKVLFNAPADDKLQIDRDVKWATVTLMFMVALMDDHIDAQERDVIAGSMRARFDLSEEESRTLLAEAEEAAHDANHFQKFTAEIKNACDDEGRIAIMELLWRVVCADGEIHHREANLMRRIAGLLYVTDKDSGLARQRALATIEAENAMS